MEVPPNSRMVYFMENPIQMGWFWSSPISGNLLFVGPLERW